MTSSTTTESASPPRRPWYRLHRSTYVVILLLVFVVTLLNLPGDLQSPPGLVRWQHDLEYDCLLHERVEHGWPTVFLVRDSTYNGFTWELSPWSIFQNVVRLDLLALAMNLIVALAIIGIGTAAFERWRRRRRSIWQWHIADMLGLTLIVAACLSWFMMIHTNHARQLDIIAAAEAADTSDRQEWAYPLSPNADWTSTLPSWLSRLMGDKAPSMFRRVDSVNVAAREQLPHIAKLHTLRSANIFRDVSNADLRLMRHCQRLEALYISSSSVAGPEPLDEDGQSAGQFYVLPALPNLWSLDIGGVPFRGEGLENLPNLEAITLDDTQIGDETLATLAKCKNLRYLSVCNTSVTNVGIKHLAVLAHLEFLNISGTEVDVDGLARLARFPSLKRLAIGGSQFDKTAIPLFKKLRHLESLSISQAGLSVETRAKLQLALPHCRIEIR